jgi:hypothetical protein
MLLHTGKFFDGGGAGPPPADTHRYWRINITAVASGGIAALGEVEMYETEFGPNVITGGTASADSEFNASFVAGNASNGKYIDNPWGSSSAALPHWWRYDFGSGNDVAINAIGIMARAGSLETMPTAFDVQYSDDGSSWTTAWSESGVSWPTAYRFQKFVNPSWTEPGYTGSPHGSHTHWRYFVGINDTGSTTGFTSNSEVEWRATPGGGDQATGGTPATGGDFSASFPIANSYDNNNSTVWASGSTGGDAGANGRWNGYGFASAVSVGQLMIRSRGDTTPDSSPEDFLIQYRDGSGPITTAWSVTGSSGWGLGETRTFTDPNYV